MKKIFYNAFSYDDYSGWYICEARDLPFKLEGKNKSDYDEYFKKRDPIYKEIRQEILDLCAELGLTYEEFDGIKPVLNEEDGKILSAALIEHGWTKQFIPIGP